MYTTGGTVSDYPRTSAYFRQRLGFASQYNKRENVEWTAQNLHSTFTKSSNAFGYRVDESDANEIRHMMSGADVLLFTQGSVILSTSGEESFNIGNVNNIEQMAAGIDAKVAPLKMRNSIIYVQDKHSLVFDLAYTFEQDKYLGTDLTILVPHFIESATIVSWAYQSVPQPIVWCVLSNGTMIGMLYERDNNIFGWFERESSGGTGTIEDVTVTPEGADDVVYCVTKRTVDTKTRKFHETMWNRKFDDVRDSRFLDCSVSLDTPVTVSNMVEESGASVGIKVTATGHGFTENDIIEMDAVVGATEVNLNKYRVAEKGTNDFYLVKRDISEKANVTGIEADGSYVLVTHDATLDINTGDAVFVEGWGGLNPALNNLWHYAVRISDTTFRVATFGEALVSSALPVGLAPPTVPPTVVATIRKGTLEDKAAVSAYISGGEVRKCLTSIAGLNHLEGETDLSACADGNYVDGLTVSSGAVTIPDAAGRVCVGFGYQSRMDSLPLDTPRSDFNGRVRTIEELLLKVYKTRGLKAGADSVTLHEMKERTDEGWNEVTKLLTGETSIDLEPEANNRGKYTLIQDYPFPATVQAVGINFSVGVGTSEGRRGRGAEE